MRALVRLRFNWLWSFFLLLSIVQLFHLFFIANRMSELVTVRCIAPTTCVLYGIVALCRWYRCVRIAPSPWSSQQISGFAHTLTLTYTPNAHTRIHRVIVEHWAIACVHSSILRERLLHTNFRLQVNFYIPKANHFISQFMYSLCIKMLLVFFCLSCHKIKCRYFGFCTQADIFSSNRILLSIDKCTILASPLHFSFAMRWNLLKNGKEIISFSFDCTWFHHSFCSDFESGFSKLQLRTK